ncbi:MAG: response regulator [Alphaproteobacteria bacterium]
MNLLGRIRGYGILAVSALIFSICVLFSVDKMLKEQSSIAQAEKENIIWATTRAEIEVFRLLDAISAAGQDGSPVTVEDVNQRFEITLARFDSLRQGVFGESLRGIDGAQKTISGMTQAMAELEPQLALLRKSDRAQAEKIRALMKRATEPLGALSIQTLRADEMLAAERRARVRGVYIELAGYFIGILVSGTVLVALLFVGVQRARGLLEARQRTEERLRESETRFRDFASSASDWLWDTDDRLRFTYFSKGYLERVGANAIAILGKTFEEIAVVPSDETKWAEFREILAKRQPFREVRFQMRADGTTARHIKISGVPVFDIEGNLTGYRGTGTDITEQVVAEGEANRVRSLLEDAIEALAEGFIILDPEDRFVLANTKYRNLYPLLADLLKPGVYFEEIVREALKREAISIPEGQEDSWLQERMAMHRSSAKSSEQRLTDGRWVQVNEQILKNGWHIGTRVDITQLKQREQALRREALIWEQMYDGVIITDLQGRITNWNPAAEAVFGYPASETLGRTPDILRRADSDSGHTARILDAVRRDGRWSGEIDFVRKDSSEGICQTVVAPLRTEDGHLIAAIWVNQDITEQKQSEEALRAAKEQAESANVTKSRFLATMSHEIRTPMNGVLGMLDLVLDTPLDEEQNSYVNTARKSGEALMVILDDVLDFSKMEAGKLSLESVNLDLREVVEDVLGLLSIQAQSKGIEISAIIEPDVPTLLRGDPGRIRQILLNLVGNAVKFTQQGGVGVTVATEKVGAGHARLRVEIMDTGVGIPFERQKDMFNEFTQADPSTTRRFGGTGLGLAISKKLVELMDGNIGVNSIPGRGSTFWFVINLELQMGAPVPADEWDARIGARRILVVDNNPISGRIMERRLAARGQFTKLARTGAEAIALMTAAATEESGFEAALIDKELPDMAGEQLAERIRNIPRLGAPKLALLCQATDRVTTERASAVGFDGHLVKPVRQRALSETIASMFGFTVAGTTRASAGESDARKAALTPHAVGRPRAKLLLAEDSKINQVVAIAMLGKSGYLIDAVDNGREALEAVSSRPYDLVLMDVSMPEMDGLDATRAIRALSGDVRRIPIIAMTAHAMESDREICLAAGMNDYVTKPVDRVKLLNAVARWLGTDNKPTARATPQPNTAPEQSAAQTAKPAATQTPVPRPPAPAPTRPILRVNPIATRANGAKNAPIARSSGQAVGGRIEEPKALVLDGEVLRQLERDTNSVIIQDLIGTFVAELAERLQRITAAVRVGDMSAMLREAHALKSSSGTFGALQLQAQARAIEMACREGREAEVPELVRPVNAMALDASRALVGWIKPGRAPEGDARR